MPKVAEDRGVVLLHAAACRTAPGNLKGAYTPGTDDASAEGDSGQTASPERVEEGGG